jgi:hypothetical protein
MFFIICVDNLNAAINMHLFYYFIYFYWEVFLLYISENNFSAIYLLIGIGL